VVDDGAGLDDDGVDKVCEGCGVWKKGVVVGKGND
jgi:hypothetical protein